MNKEIVPSLEANPANEGTVGNVPIPQTAVPKEANSGRIVEVVGTFILATAAGFLFNSGFYRLSEICVLLSMLCGILLIANYCKAAGRKNVTRWATIAGVIAAVFVISFAHPPDLASVKPTDMLSKPGAEDVMSACESAIPMQQAGVASGYVGVPVIWKLDLRKANGEQGIIHLVLIAKHDHSASSDIRIDVPEKGNEFLKMANKGDSLVIKGNIQKVSDAGIDLAPGGTILPTK